MRVTALVLLALAPFIQEPPRDRVPRQQPAGTAVIRGRVIASDTGLPIRHGSVVLSVVPPSTQLGSNGRVVTPDGSVYSSQLRPRQTTTDAEGAFEFTSLPAGSYRVHASPGQYGSQYLGLGYGARSVLFGGDPGRAITIGPGEVFDKATVVLPRGGVITGRITDEAGQALPRVQVYGLVYLHASSRGQRVGAPTTSDDLGQFRLFGLQPGDYVVAAEAPGGSFVPPNAEKRDEQTGFIPTYFPGTPDLAAAQKVRVAVGRETAGIELRMVEGRLYRVSGTVMDSQGRPAPRVNGSLMRRSPDGGTTFGSGFSTDEQGRFQMQNIAPGTYRLSIRPRSFGGSPDSSADPAEMALVPLTVADTDVEGLVVVLTRGATITGHVVFEQGPPASMGGSPLRVSAVPGDQDYYGMMQEPAVVKPNLEFTMKGLMGEILLRTGGPDMTLKQVLSGAQDITDTPHAFKDGDRVTIVLTSRTSTIEGSVMDDKGVPVNEPTAIIMFPEEKARWRSSSLGVRRASVDEKGHFQMRSLLAGRYYILAAPRTRLFVAGPTEPSFFEALVKDATTIYIGEDEQRTVDLKLVPLADQ